MIKSLIDQIRNPTNFSKNVARVTSGSAVAAIVFFIGIKLVTELYSPKVYGNYGLLVSIILLFSETATFKYEMAIPLPENLEERYLISWISLFGLIVFTAIIGLIFLVAGSHALRFLNAEDLLPYVHLIVLGIFAKGLFSNGTICINSLARFH